MSNKKGRSTFTNAIVIQENVNIGNPDRIVSTANLIQLPPCILYKIQAQLNN